MTGMVAGVGFKAVAGKIFGDFGRWIGRQDAIHLLAWALAVFAIVEFVHIHGFEVKLPFGAKIHFVGMQGKIDAANAKTAQVEKDLQTSRANEAGLTKAIQDQNKSIADLSSKSAAQQTAALKALGVASSRADAAAAAARRLKTSAAQRPSGAACEPSATLKKQWH
jgi:hypothetical protein